MLASEDRETRHGVLTALRRIADVPEPCERMWNGEYRNNVFEILEKVAGTCEGRKALSRAKVEGHLVSELEKMVPTDPMRPVFMRIYSRMELKP